MDKVRTGGALKSKSVWTSNKAESFLSTLSLKQTGVWDMNSQL